MKTSTIFLFFINWTISDISAEQIFRYFDIKFTNETVSLANTFRTANVGSILKCAGLCKQEIGCQTGSFHEDGECRLSLTTLGTGCDICENFQSSQVFKVASVSQCLNGGIANPNGNCTCFGGYIGQYCENIMKDCVDGLSHYDGQEGIFTIQPVTAPWPFQVYCSFHPGYLRPRLYMQRHLSQVGFFNHTWIEYSSGFGDMHTNASNFWLGNKYLNYITTSDIYTLVFEMADDTWTNIYQQEYPHVVVGDEASFFKLEINGVSTTTESGYSLLGDSFSILNGQYFSTYDMDNDGNSNNCAAMHGCGFWFGVFTSNECTLVNPNGKLIDDPNSVRLGFEYEVFWASMAIWSPWHVQMWLERR